MSYDQLALKVLLSKDNEATKQKKLQALMAHAKGERKCPECSKVAVHEDNGETGRNLSWLCTDCGTSWDEFPE